MLSLHIGAEIPRATQLKRDDISEKQQNFKGEHRISFWQVGWKIYENAEVICHSNSSNAADGPMRKVFPLLHNKWIERVQLGVTPDKLKIFFSNGYRLRTGAWTEDPKDLCYVLYSFGMYYNIRVGGEIEINPSNRKPETST
jgi:hypothetical protein